MTAPALFAYQDTGADFLAARGRALLCDEMGLGKTPQAVAAADRAECRRVLVLAPAAVTENWRREFLRWQRLPRAATVLRRVPDSAAPPAGVWIVSYDLARRAPMLNALRARGGWDALICDEAHYLKTRTAARTAAAAALAAGAERAWRLTGTPMPNTADELWSLLHLFGPAALGAPPMAYWPFRKRYCVEVPLGGTGRSKIVGVRHAEELKARMAPVLLRRKKAEVLTDLPPLRQGEIALSAEDYARELDAAEDGEAGRLIREIMADWLVSDDVDSRAWQILQLASDESVSRLRRLTATVKARALAPLLAEELDQTDGKMVVMGWHRETLDVLQDRLAGFGAVRLCGQTPPAERQRAIDPFHGEGGPRVFLGQIQAAGTGITLTAAADLVFAEMSWTPSDNAQAATRVHRIGQTRPVLVRYAVLADTIDEAVVRTLRRKSQDIQTVLN